MSNSQLARDMMMPMTQEFVSEINDGETKLNEGIDDLLYGIDFQQSMSQEKSPNYIPSTFPEQNGTFNIQQFSTISIPRKLTKLYSIYLS